MLLEIRDLGFTHAELSHGIRISLMPGILKAVEAGDIRISTLHNFCPLPVGINHAAPNLHQFSASAKRERELAVRYTLKTLDFAAQVGASVVVLHCGSIVMEDVSTELEDLAKVGGNATPTYQQLLAKALHKRAEAAPPWVQRAKETLLTIAPEAEKRGIRLGVECREAVEEIPLETDLEAFLSDLPAQVFGYWHDTGHAQIKENLGLRGHVDGLRAMTERLLGFHVHDVSFPAKDHRAIGKGMIDFSRLRPFAKPEHIRVLELHPSLSAAEVQQSYSNLREQWDAE